MQHVYALVLHEREPELKQKGGKLLLRAWFCIAIKIKKIIITKYAEVVAFLAKTTTTTKKTNKRFHNKWTFRKRNCIGCRF